MSEAESAGRRGSAGRAFTEFEVVGTALGLLDAGGPSALSIGAVAARLGVEADAVSSVAGSRVELERAVIERVLSAVPVGPLSDAGVEWSAAVIQFALGMRDQLLAHPAVVTLMMSGPMDGPAADGPVARDISEALLACLTRGGLPAQARAHGVYSVLVQVLGAVALDVAETDGKPPLPPESERVRQRRAALDDIDSARWPRTTAHLDEIAAWNSVDQFVWSLRTLLTGMVAA
ncbi:TetR family transcriptional regulator [Nocardia mangyaensis]|uniref:TetR family transcriptional regulator n=1 Tax=Nocardia mangyaensis TaxID=2213200 RepID=A0A1J0VZ11_9NOCA|nr:TetR/AcrR family transcriptional regulator C-terminal domain-containing protein [Nocardia mangyaensis]APE37250.1 TetR family transcriptional regulator [Nocardia mangyaensis]